jgi:DNA-binding transcriptional LysR family regulator
MDRFTELAAFVRTVDRGSQAAAARELGVTPAMVGRYIRALEDRLGARLLNRTTTNQSLTEAGTAFHTRAAALLEQLEAAEDVVADRQAAPRGLLRVSGPMSFGVRYLAAAVAGFGALHPGLRAELSLNDRVVDLVEEGYDLAVRIGRLADSSLVARRLAPCRVAVCAAPAYVAQHGAPERPEELREHKCLLYSYAANGGTWRFVRADGREVRVEVDGPLTANNGDAVLAAALEGAGVLLQPTFIVGDALREGRLVRLLPGWGVPELAVYAVYPSARHLSPKVRSCVDFLAGQFGESPPWDRGL